MGATRLSGPDRPAGGGAPSRVTVAPPGPSLRAARLITELTAPAVLVTTLTVLIGWHGGRSGAHGLAWGLLATVFASGIPFAYIVGGVRRGRLTDHHVGVREQRRLPLLFGLTSTAGGWALLAALGAPRPLLALVAAGVVGLVVAVTVSHWWKMSIHTAVAAGAVVVLVLTFGPLLLTAAPLPVLAGWSRVRLRAHTVPQVLVGGTVGGLVAGAVYGALS
ncbi:phosphatase PAP2 family protein [Micromonospora sp. KC207]|uniref:phosphatase PAP2 family protein n=1 Tax=Micromonospora sp. KC207 TaxID=2530377 RepID=UPI00104DDC0A|nr:phosphatase PAP2 family protein [Micromonospora sp. KC207]TDC65460.1 phosphatase PAP2 family protein [Micromonospora sp. KC207]